MSQRDTYHRAGELRCHRSLCIIRNHYAADALIYDEYVQPPGHPIHVVLIDSAELLAIDPQQLLAKSDDALLDHRPHIPTAQARVEFNSLSQAQVGKFRPSSVLPMQSDDP